MKDRSAAIQQRLEEAGADMQNRKQPSTGYPHQRIGNARGHEADRRREVFGRVVCQQSEILRRHLRKREHRGGSPAQGRETPHIQKTEVKRKHRREIADKETKHKEEISFLKTVIAKAAAWFPYFRKILRIENLCRFMGFDERQIATLAKGKPLEYVGGTLFGGTRTGIHDRKGKISSSERPHGRNEISSYH